MPLKHTLEAVPDECDGVSWHVVDLDELARRVALILISQHEHVLALSQCSPTLDLPVVPKRTVVSSLLADVLRPPIHNNDRFQRDGLLFQHVMWVAGTLLATDGDLFSRPHVRKADKGHDMLIVSAPQVAGAEATSVKVEAVQICEHKATDGPRGKITQQVWPDILAFERGEMDASLESEVLSILSEAHGKATARTILTKIFWEERRRYRVSVTADAVDCTGLARAALFAGFASKATGNQTRRFGETFPVTDVRGWFDDFASRVVTQLLLFGEVAPV